MPKCSLCPLIAPARHWLKGQHSRQPYHPNASRLRALCNCLSRINYCSLKFFHLKVPPTWPLPARVGPGIRKPFQRLRPSMLRASASRRGVSHRRDDAALFGRQLRDRAARRRGWYNVDRLIAEHGDAKLTDLLGTLADCPKARSVSIHDRCKAVYEKL